MNEDNRLIPLALLLVGCLATMGWSLHLNDDDRIIALALSLLAGCVAVLGLPFLIYFGRSTGRETRVHLARSVLALGILSLLWLDAVVLMHAFNLQAGHPFVCHACVAGFFVLAYATLMPWRDGTWREAVASVLVLFGTALAVIPVPWSEDKRAVLDVARIADQPLPTVQEVMADYWVDVYSAGSRERLPLAPETRVCDLDLVALAPTRLVFYPALGGCQVEIDSGRIGSIWFNYD
jgi:hypothetical protein